jgi:3'-phosphoadenosine 5'-phosphosulfate sulfotransferase (PAPS reductase)/FAD synthetase
MSQLHAFSFGGGVQSTAALVLAARGELPATDESNRWDVFIFANVGEGAEHPETLRYVEEYAKPYAAEHGIELVEVRKRRRDGTSDDLRERIRRGYTPPQASFPFPVRMANGMPGRRSCTAEYKVRPIEAELKRRGASDDSPAIVGLGITLDEVQRAKHWGKADPRSPSQVLEYPLLRLGMRREDSLRVIADAGLPEPPRSACWFCPFHSLDEWRRLRREQPDLFAEAQEIETAIQARQAELGRRPLYMTRYARPLSEAVQDQLVIGDDEHPCDAGRCFT